LDVGGRRAFCTQYKVPDASLIFIERTELSATMAWDTDENLGVSLLKSHSWIPMTDRRYQGFPVALWVAEEMEVMPRGTFCVNAGSGTLKST
jgi:hypothetical protein